MRMQTPLRQAARGGGLNGVTEAMTASILVLTEVARLLA